MIYVVTLLKGNENFARKNATRYRS